MTAETTHAEPIRAALYVSHSQSTPSVMLISRISPPPSATVFSSVEQSRQSRRKVSLSTEIGICQGSCNIERCFRRDRASPSQLHPACFGRGGRNERVSVLAVRT